MITLAIETATTRGSVALLREGQSAKVRNLDPLVGSARTLAPAIELLLTDAKIGPRQVDLIAVSTGPGSFTGLRVGIATAKTLAYALGCGIVGIDTLDAIAEQVGDVAAATLHAVIDAQRRELFLARYERTGQSDAAVHWQRSGQTQIVAADQWLAQLAPGTIVTGPGLRRLLPELPASVLAAAEERWMPQAATIGRLGLVAWQSGRRDDLFQLKPTYLRPSYAEEGPRSIVQSPKSGL